MSRIANDKVKVQRLPTRVPSIADVLKQIEAEYREMPGLSVTEAQAQRLWGLDNPTCRRALDTLVHRGVLRRTRREAYVRAETFSSLAVVSAGDGARRPR
jgi:DNA-binding IclR family transcriptional regulator